MFLERWNKRFAVAPRQAEDAHRPWSRSKADLAEALARREERTLSKALTFTASATRYAVKTAGPGIALRGAKVTLLHMLDGTMRVRFKDRPNPTASARKGGISTWPKKGTWVLCLDRTDSEQSG